MKRFYNFVNENKHKDIDPYDEEIWSDTPKMKLITQIKNIVDKYGGYITMMDLQAGASPYYKEVGDDIHLVERLMRDEVEIVAYGGYKNQDEVDDYEVGYEDLDMPTLKEIKKLLDIAIENDLLEEDI